MPADTTIRANAALGRRLVGAFAGALLLAINVGIYVTRPRLVYIFWRRVGRLPNIAEPRTHNEKLQWRKVLDRNPLFPILQDKLNGRAFVAARCPELALPEILWIGKNPHAIPFDAFDGPVVIKTNHGCGYNYFVAEPRNVDRLHIWFFFARVLGGRWGRKEGEWAHGAIKPVLYVERMLLKPDGAPEADLHINVFDGKTHLYAITSGRHGDRNTVCFDAGDRRIEASLNQYDAADVPAPGPLHARARMLAESLLPELDAIRGDCYIRAGRIWFGEFTVYPGSGHQVFKPKSFAVERSRPWNVLNAHYFTTANPVPVALSPLPRDSAPQVYLTGNSSSLPCPRAHTPRNTPLVSMS